MGRALKLQKTFLDVFVAPSYTVARWRGVAQLVAHRVWDAGVRGSSPRTPTCRGRRQVVRHQPSKLTFAGSNPVARSDLRACSSMAEQSAHNRPVPGSNPGGPIVILCP